MARRKRTKRLRPKTPSRVKKRKRSGGARSHHHPELWGLGLVVVGLFLGSVLDLGWSGGPVGNRLADAVHALVGAAAYVTPVVLLGIGGLMVARSALVDVRPFRVGLAVLVGGLLV